MCFLTEIIVCVAYLRQKSRVNFRSTKVDAGKLKRKYLNSTLAVNVLTETDRKNTLNLSTNKISFNKEVFYYHDGYRTEEETHL
jgi:hypothetical protein